MLRRSLGDMNATSAPSNGKANDRSTTSFGDLLSNATTTDSIPVPVVPITMVVPTDDTASSSHIFSYVFVPIGILLLLFFLAALVVFIIRKSRLDKLRHHLMPLYNFDPAEEGEDWESELLEEGMAHNMTSRMKMHVESPSPTDVPKLSFSRDMGL